MPEDLALCYPSAYFTHSTPAIADADEGPDSLRSWLRKVVLASLARPYEQPLIRRFVGRTLGAVPFVRRRACYGLIDELAPTTNGCRCLEVGPGRGQDLRRLRLLGWQAFGIDVDPVAAVSAARFSGCEVRSGIVADVDFPESWFALIYMSHSLEHLPDLVTSLRRCYELLQQGGRVVLVYPNPGALTARWYGARSPIWDPPRHLVLPPLDAIVDLLARIGFVQIRVRSIARYARGYRSVAKEYAAGRRGCGFMPGAPTFGDTVFACIERLLTGVGVRVGEEIVAVAHKAAE
jgi:SAM-dependent methyltransferase